MSRDFRVATDTQCCQDLKIVPVLVRHGAVYVLSVGRVRRIPWTFGEKSRVSHPAMVSHLLVPTKQLKNNCEEVFSKTS